MSLKPCLTYTIFITHIPQVEKGEKHISNLTEEIGSSELSMLNQQRQFPPGLTIHFLENWAVSKEETRKVAAGKQPELLQKLQSMPTAQRRDFLLNYLRSLVAKVLNLPSPEQIEPRQRLFDLGLDSLMAVEAS